MLFHVYRCLGVSLGLVKAVRWSNVMKKSIEFALTVKSRRLRCLTNRVELREPVDLLDSDVQPKITGQS